MQQQNFVQILGCGDAFGSGGRLQTCFLVKSSTSTVLIDCGATTLSAMKRYDVDPNSIECIFISHFHGDHFGGLPYFILEAALVSKRTKPLKIIGPKGIQEKTVQAQEILYPNSSSMELPYDLEYLEIDSDAATEIENFKVTYIPVIHSLEASPHAVRLEFDKNCVAYSGDTEWTDRLIEVAEGADLFIVEASTYDKEVKHHLSYKTIIKNLHKLNCKKVILTHMGNQTLNNIGLLKIDPAQEGEIIDL